MNPVQHPEAWDVTLAGVTWSGSATVAGLKYAMAWDVKDAEGANGASLSRKGRKLSRFTIRFGMVYDPTQGIDQFAEWYSTWVPLLKSCCVGTEPVGLALEHADAQALDVASVVVEEIGQVQLGEDLGGGYVDVALLQYAPAAAVSTSGPSRTKSDPNNPIQQRIDKLDTLLAGP